MTTEKKVTKAQREFEAFAKRVYKHLKKHALKEVEKNDGWGWRHHYRKPGWILSAMGIDRGWDARNAAYRRMTRALKHGEALGLLKSDYSTPTEYRYAGPEIEAAEKAVRQRAERIRKAVSKALKAHKIKNQARNGGATVSLGNADFLRLCGVEVPA